MWIYISLDSQSEEDKIKKQVLASLFVNTEQIIISSQVLNEVVNVVLRKFKKTAEEADILVQKIMEQSVVIELKPKHTLDALNLKQVYNFSWFDALIVAAALDTQCNILYSEDMQHGLIVNEKLQIVNPFVELP
ncbi:MAG: PIN domain-containing protein [Bacteroidota bacterium]